MSPRSLPFRGAPVRPVPSASASMGASFRLLPSVRARSRKATSRAVGMPRTVCAFLCSCTNLHTRLLLAWSPACQVREVDDPLGVVPEVLVGDEGIGHDLR